MASKAIQRTLLVLALIVTAHLVKPFSVRNVASHLLRSANSFSFMLPGSAVGSLEQANYLAMILDNGFQRREAPPPAAWGPELAFAPRMFAPERVSLKPSDTKASAETAKAEAKCRETEKARPMRAPRVEVARRAKPAAEAVAINLPAAQVIEKVVTVNLPAVKSQLAQIERGMLESHFVPVKLLAPEPDADCPTAKSKPRKIARAREALSLEEAQEKLRASIHLMLNGLQPPKLVCQASELPNQKLLIRCIVKSS
jgi:hypothetical protein